MRYDLPWENRMSFPDFAQKNGNQVCVSGQELVSYCLSTLAVTVSNGDHVRLCNRECENLCGKYH